MNLWMRKSICGVTMAAQINHFENTTLEAIQNNWALSFVVVVVDSLLLLLFKICVKYWTYQ